MFPMWVHVLGVQSGAGGWMVVALSEEGGGKIFGGKIFTDLRTPPLVLWLLGWGGVFPPRGAVSP